MTTLSAERLAELEAGYGPSKQEVAWMIARIRELENVVSAIDEIKRLNTLEREMRAAAESALAAARATLRDVQALLLAIDNMSWKNNIGLPAEFGTVNAKVAITLAALTETGHDR